MVGESSVYAGTPDKRPVLGSTPRPTTATVKRVANLYDVWH